MSTPGRIFQTHHFRALPPVAIVLTAAGVIPFAILGIASVGGAADSALNAVRGLVGYGAVILAFLGGVHWGFTLGEPDEDGPPGMARAIRGRLSLAVLPSLVGWAAILCSVVSRPALGLLVLIAGFVATVAVESRASHQAQIPSGYMALRWVASVVVIALLTTVVVLRMAGAHVLL